MKSINDYLRTVLLALRFSFGELLMVNILWVLLMIPVVTIPPAFAGLYYATNQLANEKKVTCHTFFEGFKKYLSKSYLWFLVNTVVIGLLLFNINLGVRLPETAWLQQLGIFYWIFLLIWLSLQIYMFPFLIEQDEPQLWMALRNSVILWIKHLFFNIFLVAIFWFLIAVSYFIYPFWFVITASFIAYLSNLGLIYLLSKEKRL